MQFATDFFVGQAATFDLSHCLSEAVVIITVTLIVTKRLLVKIAEQMERLDADVGSMKGTRQEAPEIEGVSNSVGGLRDRAPARLVKSGGTNLIEKENRP